MAQKEDRPLQSPHPAPLLDSRPLSPVRPHDHERETEGGRKLGDRVDKVGDPLVRRHAAEEEEVLRRQAVRPAVGAGRGPFRDVDAGGDQANAVGRSELTDQARFAFGLDDQRPGDPVGGGSEPDILDPQHPPFPGGFAVVRGVVMRGNDQRDVASIRHGRRLEDVAVPVGMRMHDVGPARRERIHEADHHRHREAGNEPLAHGEPVDRNSVHDGGVVVPADPPGLVVEVARVDLDVVARRAQTAAHLSHVRLHAPRCVESKGHLGDLHRVLTSS